MEMFTPYLVVLAVSFVDITVAEICYREDFFGYDYYEYCPFGCCGYGYFKDCCSATWPIIGIVIGVSVMIAVIVTIICCCRRSRGAPGMVCQTNPRATTTVLTTGQVQAGYPTQTVVTYPVQPGYPTTYHSPAGYVPAPQGYPQYPPTAQAGMVGSSTTGYTYQPEVKAASAPPMEPPPPYPQ